MLRPAEETWGSRRGFPDFEPAPALRLRARPRPTSQPHPCCRSAVSLLAMSLRAAGRLTALRSRSPASAVATRGIRVGLGYVPQSVRPNSDQPRPPLLSLRQELTPPDLALHLLSRLLLLFALVTTLSRPRHCQSSRSLLEPNRRPSFSPASPTSTPFMTASRRLCSRRSEDSRAKVSGHRFQGCRRWARSVGDGRARRRCLKSPISACESGS